MPTKSAAKGKRAPAELITDPAEAAKAAALRHVSDEKPGIQRKGAGSGFSYVGPDNRAIRDKATLSRIRALVIPPAWTDVWISPAPNGHIQATGRDARGRKQYRYHTRWREVRDENKYGRMVLFGNALPQIRARVTKDLALAGLPRDKVLAMVVRLLETTYMRVGNEEYARTNGSFGLTTLLDQHVRFEGTKLRFRFRGKSGKDHAIVVSDRRMTTLVRRCRDLPGQDLFQYLDDADDPQPINSTDVNDYLRLAPDHDFTAKDFRTWAGTLLAICQLAGSKCFDDDVTAKASKEAIAAAVNAVAEQLGNTATVCRKCYIHPAVIDAYQNRELYDLWIASSAKARAKEGLSKEETALITYLTDWLGVARKAA